MKLNKNRSFIYGRSSWFLMSILTFCCLAVHLHSVDAAGGGRKFTVSIAHDKENKAEVSIVGGNITDPDLKIIKSVSQIEKLSICASSTAVLSKAGFEDAVTGLPIKELRLSFLSGGNMDFLGGIEELKLLQKVILNVNELSDKFISSLSQIRLADNKITLGISILDGESISYEILLKLDNLKAFSNIYLVPRLNAQSAIELAATKKFKRILILETLGEKPATSD